MDAALAGTYVAFFAVVSSAWNWIEIKRWRKKEAGGIRDIDREKYNKEFFEGLKQQ